MLSCHEALTSLGSSSNEDGDVNAENGKIRLWCVSLLKSKSGILLRKQIFRFFTKIPKRIIDTNNPQRRWILFFWILSKTGYFGYMIPRVALLRIRKDWILQAVIQNSLNTRYISCLTALLILTAILKTKARIKRLFLSIYRFGNEALTLLGSSSNEDGDFNENGKWR